MRAVRRGRSVRGDGARHPTVREESMQRRGSTPLPKASRTARGTDMKAIAAHALPPPSRTRAAVVFALVLAGAAMVVSAGIALATPAVDFTPILLSRATLTQNVHLNTDDIKFQARDATDVALAMVAIKPGGNSGWHHHPGVVFASVKSGELTVLDSSCNPTTYPAGTVLVETGDDPLLVQNKTDGDTLVYATYVAPKGVPLRIDDPAPACAE
jgi:quercetin dioxygenase-like cupin family protein